MNKFYIYDHDKEKALMVKNKSDFMSWLNDHADKDRYSFFSTQEEMESYFNKVFEEIKQWVKLHIQIPKMIEGIGQHTFMKINMIAK